MGREINSVDWKAIPAPSRKSRFWFIIPLAVYIIVVATYSVWSYRTERSFILSQIDSKLLIGAKALDMMIPDDFHDRATGPGAISPEEDRRIAARLTKFAKETEFLYAYTVIKDGDSLYFAACDLIADPPPGRGTFYYLLYAEADSSFYRAFESTQPVYSQYSDRWGEARTIMLPRVSRYGRKYLACVDYDVSFIRVLLRRNIYRSIAVGIVFLLLTIPFILAYRAMRREGWRKLKKTNAALKESEERLALAMRGADMGSWDWDVRSGRLTIDQRWSHMLGYRPEDLEPSFRMLKDLIHPDDLKEFEQRISRNLKNETTFFQMEYRLRHRNGEYVHVLCRGRVIERDRSGNPLRACGTHLDITKQKALENQVLHSQKLESLGVLVGGIAHDFNNLLMGILGNAEMGSRYVPEDSRAGNALIEIRSIAKCAADLVNQMLAYSGKARFVISEFYLGDLVTEMYNLLKVVHSKKVTLELELQDDMPPFRGDATQIKQVIMNLVTNAADAIGDAQGTVVVTTGVEHCDSERFRAGDIVSGPGSPGDLPAGDYLFIEVRDTGAGMDDYVLGKMFDPFFTTKFTGRGLGMAAVLGIVRSHRGAISIRSRVGSGTCIRVLLPATGIDLPDPPDEPEMVNVPGDPWTGTGTVLLAEDEDTVREITSKMLELMGFDVTETGDGKEALDVFSRDPGGFECVVLDLIMPRLNGLETYRLMKEIRDDLKVIIYSGYERDSILESISEFENVVFMTKPFQMEDLRENVRKLLDR